MWKTGLVVGLLENKDFNDWYDLKPANDTVVVIRFLSEMMSIWISLMWTAGWNTQLMQLQTKASSFYPNMPEVFSRFFWQLIFWSSSLQFLRFLSPTDIKKLYAFFPFSVLKENKFHSHDVHSQLKNLQVLQEAIAKLFGFEPGQITSLIS